MRRDEIAAFQMGHHQQPPCQQRPGLPTKAIRTLRGKLQHAGGGGSTAVHVIRAGDRVTQGGQGGRFDDGVPAVPSHCHGGFGNEDPLLLAEFRGPGQGKATADGREQGVHPICLSAGRVRDRSRQRDVGPL